MRTIIRNARVLTLAGPRRRRGAMLSDLGVVDRADVVIERGTIAGVEPAAAPNPGDRFIDAQGRVVMPAFVDCHTHACWAGDRINEWKMKLAGAAYLDILKAGGGIMSTVRAVRGVDESELKSQLVNRLMAMVRAGSATIEVKSGYGLSADAELKMLRAIRAAASDVPATIIPTALLGHAIDGDPAAFARTTIDETLPAVSREFPGITIDAFCESGAWSLEDTVRLFERARHLGHSIRVHADQFNSLGMLRAAANLGARSVDHLEASKSEDLDFLAASETYGVIMPCCGFHVDGRYAKVRRFIDSGGLLAIATNYNPGSAPCPAMPMAIALAVRHCGASVEEAISAATVNAADLLGLQDRGQVAAGQRADLVMLHHTDERMLAYEFGADHISAVMIGGVLVPR